MEAFKRFCATFADGFLSIAVFVCVMAGLAMFDQHASQELKSLLTTIALSVVGIAAGAAACLLVGVFVRIHTKDGRSLLFGWYTRRQERKM